MAHETPRTSQRYGTESLKGAAIMPRASHTVDEQSFQHDLFMFSGGGIIFILTVGWPFKLLVGVALVENLINLLSFHIRCGLRRALLLRAEY